MCILFDYQLVWVVGYFQDKQYKSEGRQGFYIQYQLLGVIVDELVGNIGNYNVQYDIELKKSDQLFMLFFGGYFGDVYRSYYGRSIYVQFVDEVEEYEIVYIGGES